MCAIKPHVPPFEAAEMKQGDVLKTWRIPRLWTAIKIALRLLTYRIRETLFLLAAMLLACPMGCETLPERESRPRRRAGRRVDRVPLTPERLLCWANTASNLGILREKGKFPFYGSSLDALLHWGERNPEELAKRIGGASAYDFLGVMLSLHRTRGKLGRLAEYAALAAQEKPAFRTLAGALPLPFVPDLPSLSQAEKSDLRAYAEVDLHVEQALCDLLPGIPPPVPAGCPIGKLLGETETASPGTLALHLLGRLDAGEAQVVRSRR
jgi:hypothetical protein